MDRRDRLERGRNDLDFARERELQRVRTWNSVRKGRALRALESNLAVSCLLGAPTPGARFSF